MKTVKTFDDLIFTPHRNGGYGFDTQAEMEFENGYGISVITGSAAYSSDIEPYEVAIKAGGGEICYTTPITNGVIGYCDDEKVTEIMKQVQELPIEQPKIMV